jgi:hypothetical protein
VKKVPQIPSSSHEVHQLNNARSQCDESFYSIVVRWNPLMRVSILLFIIVLDQLYSTLDQLYSTLGYSQSDAPSRGNEQTFASSQRSIEPSQHFGLYTDHSLRVSLSNGSDPGITLQACLGTCSSN